MTHRLKLVSIAFLTFLCLLNAPSLFSSQTESPDQFPYAQAIQAIEKFAREQMDIDKTPGFSVGFLKDDFTWTHALGYPDLHQDMIRIAEYHVQKYDLQKAFLLLNMAKDLYPNRIDPLASLASLHLLTGNKQEARRFFQKTFVENPKHPGVSIGRFLSLTHYLINGEKHDQLPILTEIATELHPRSFELSSSLGDSFLRIGQKEQALKYYRQALELNPKLSDVHKKVDNLEREIEK